MKAMILAAGEGTRMRPLTLTTPKPLILIGEQPLIVHHIQRLKNAGISEIVINLHYLGTQIRDYLGCGKQWGVRIQYSEEQVRLETGGAIWQARNLLGDAPFLLVNGDVWTDFDFKPWVTRFSHCAGNQGFGHLMMVANPAHNPQGDFIVSESGHVAVKKPDEVGKTFAGVSVLTMASLKAMGVTETHFPLRDLFYFLIKTHNLTAEVVDDLWIDVGTPARLAQVRQLV